MRWVTLTPVLVVAVVLSEVQAYQESEVTRPTQTQLPESGSIIDTTFVFSNGKSICLGGWMDIENGTEVFSEFVLRDCNTGAKLGERGEECHLLFRSDTLWVYQLELLAMGENFELVMFPWKIEAFYLENGRFGHTERLNENLRYDEQTIDLIQKEYDTTELRDQKQDWEYVEFHLMPLVNKLMIAAISGSQESEMKFKEFRTKVQLDGATALWYSIMERILTYAKNN